MHNKLTWKENMYIGSMLFGLFFGAGNLIFPIHLGQASGPNVILANIGFLVTAIGLPFLGVIAASFSQKKDIFAISMKVNRHYAYIFTITLYLVIGPIYALPRLASTSFEVGLSPFISQNLYKPFLFIFSLLFFILTWVFSRNTAKILEYIGKILNPIFVFLLSIILTLSFLQPMGTITSGSISNEYKQTPFFKGFVDGYNTLDALAALAFGMIIVKTIKDMGISEPLNITRETIKSGAISMVLMALIYSLLAIIGSMSLGEFEPHENGGITLTLIIKYYIGEYGMIFLAVIITIACLKTAIGLNASFSETFSNLFPKFNYIFFTTLSCIVSFLISNVGLTYIIKISTPILLLLYPLAIVLILLEIINFKFFCSKIVYNSTILFTLLAAVIDVIKHCPPFISDTNLFESITSVFEKYIPLSSIGMGWIPLSIIGFIFGVILRKMLNNYNYR